MKTFLNLLAQNTNSIEGLFIAYKPLETASFKDNRYLHESSIVCVRIEREKYVSDPQYKGFNYKT